jgi:septum formation protein
MRIVLASASPRRQQLLRERGVVFDAAPVDIDEDLQGAGSPGAAPADFAMALALRKALARAALEPGPARVLGADTIVVAPGGELLAKPRDERDAARMMRLLSGRVHEVVTGIAWVAAESGRARARAVSSRVRFRALGDESIRRYVESGLWRGKAGGYGVQDGALVESLEGSRSNVVGLPVEETMALFEEVEA